MPLRFHLFCGNYSIIRENSLGYVWIFGELESQGPGIADQKIL